MTEQVNESYQHKRKQYPFGNNWNERQYFIYACFAPDLQEFYRQWVEQGWKQGRIQFFTEYIPGTLVHKYWSPDNICCETGETLTRDNMDIKVGYWTPMVWKPIRKDLLHQAKQFEAYQCQLIDKSCNDCLHLIREGEGRGNRALFSWCGKLDKKTEVHANTCQPEHTDCFTHRKTT